MIRKILMGLGVLVVICIGFFAITFGLAMVATNGVADAANTFMTKLQFGDIDAAYAMFTPELKEAMDADTFASAMSDASIESWSFNDRSVENNTGHVGGTTTIGGEPFTVSLDFINNDGWKLIAFDFSPQQ